MSFNANQDSYTLGFGVSINEPLPRLTSDAEFQLGMRPLDFDEWEESERAAYERRTMQYRREWNSTHQIMLDSPLSVDMLYVDKDG